MKRNFLYFLTLFIEKNEMILKKLKKKNIKTKRGKMDVEKKELSFSSEKDNVSNEKVFDENFTKHVFDVVITIEAPNGIIEISRCHLLTMPFFKTYFEKYGDTAKVVLNDDIKFVCELCAFLKYGTIPKNKTESLKLMHKWGLPFSQTSVIFDSIPDLAFIPNVQMDYFRPIIKIVIINFDIRTSIAVSANVSRNMRDPERRKQLRELPDHVLSEIVRIILE